MYEHNHFSGLAEKGSREAKLYTEKHLEMDFSLEAFTVPIIFQRNTARKGQEVNK